MKQASRRAVLWGGAALGLLIIVLLILRYDPEQVFLPLLRSKIDLLMAVLALQAAVHLLNAVNPVVLLGPSESGEISRWAQTRVFLAMQPLALFAPGRITDLGAVPLLKRHHRTGALASSIVLDRLITLFFILLLTPIALRLVWPISSSTSIDVAAILGVIVVASLPFVLTNRKFRGVVNRFLLRRWPSLLEGFGAHTEFLLRTSRGRILINLTLTALKTVLTGAGISLLALNVGLSLSVLTAVWMAVLIQLVTSVPLAPLGIGVAEGTLVLLFTVNGIPGALALSMGVIARAISVPVIGAIYLTTTLPLMAERFGDRERGRAQAGMTSSGLGREK